MVSTQYIDLTKLKTNWDISALGKITITLEQ